AASDRATTSKKQEDGEKHGFEQLEKRPRNKETKGLNRLLKEKIEQRKPPANTGPSDNRGDIRQREGKHPRQAITVHGKV
ncbi:hypothetical protein KXW25_007676, partial [Aspergillus fumigatus]